MVTGGLTALGGIVAVVPVAVEVPDAFVISVIAGLLGGGLLTALTGWRKAKPEMELNSVNALKISLAELRVDLDRAQERAELLQKRVDELEADRDHWRTRALAAEAAAG